MARFVKESEYTAKRNEILDVTQRLMETKGYEQMTIQDILDELKMSKGALYHYFGSKQALLHGLSERMQDDVEQLLVPIVEDPRRSAVEKFREFFSTMSQWKSAHRPLIQAVLPVWYSNDHAVFRQNVLAVAVRRASPLLTRIIRQGVQEGTFTPFDPDQAASIIFSLRQGMQDIVAGFLLSGEAKHDDLQQIQRTRDAYRDAIERILGAPQGSLHQNDPEHLKEWILP